VLISASNSRILGKTGMNGAVKRNEKISVGQQSVTNLIETKPTESLDNNEFQ